MFYLSQPVFVGFLPWCIDAFLRFPGCFQMRSQQHLSYQVSGASKTATFRRLSSPSPGEQNAYGKLGGTARTLTSITWTEQIDWNPVELKFPKKILQYLQYFLQVPSGAQNCSPLWGCCRSHSSAKQSFGWGYRKCRLLPAHFVMHSPVSVFFLRGSGWPSTLAAVNETSWNGQIEMKSTQLKMQMSRHMEFNRNQGNI